ncbi:hypothetical protein EYC84_002556 [Monilinia fructicola]|uniref:Uncharacterized protein n=1 Tax=Monilinia fructicola TaxID=38448 RepID=A0A5M9JPA7_MONFR|nr:hypothetical protein EYC84_002556 [Monilinia fructicola]
MIYIMMLQREGVSDQLAASPRSTQAPWSPSSTRSHTDVINSRGLHVSDDGITVSRHRHPAAGCRLPWG